MTDLRRGVLVVLVCTFGGCSDCNAPQGETYFEENIQPILLQKCATNTSGCHAANAGDPYQFASGNLDVTSFANIQKRRDVLETFGPYPVPLLLIKAIAPETVDDSHTRLQFQYGLDPSDPTGNTPAFHDIEVLHAGGAVHHESTPTPISRCRPGCRTARPRTGSNRRRPRKRATASAPTRSQRTSPRPRS